MTTSAGTLPPLGSVDFDQLQRTIATSTGIHAPIDSQLHALLDVYEGRTPGSTGLRAQRDSAIQILNGVLVSLGVSKPNDVLALLVEVGEIAQTNKAHDPEEAAFQRVRLRSLAAEDKLLAEEGGGLSDAQFARLLGVRSRTTVKNYRAQNRVFAIPRGPRNLIYPAWQIHNRELLPELAQILAILSKKGISPYSIALFFLTPAEALNDRRPLDLLRENETTEVISHAHRYADRA